MARHPPTVWVAEGALSRESSACPQGLGAVPRLSLQVRRPLPVPRPVTCVLRGQDTSFMNRISESPPPPATGNRRCFQRPSRRFSHQKGTCRPDSHHRPRVLHASRGLRPRLARGSSRALASRRALSHVLSSLLSTEQLSLQGAVSGGVPAPAPLPLLF